MKDDRVRIKFDDEVLQKLKDKHNDLKEYFPNTTLSNVVNNELKHLVTSKPTN